MKKVNTLHLIAVFIVFICINSCKKPNELNGNQSSQITPEMSTVPVSDGSIYKSTVLGNKLNNPFQIDTMRKAFKKLTGVECPLPVTHKYVRFLPSTQELYDSLLMDTSLILYDIPLDYEILELGDYYQSPGFSLEQITWQYTVIPAVKEIPDFVQSEILADLFLPDESNLTNCGATITIEELEEEAFRMTGNLQEYNTELTAPSSGTITNSKRGLRKYYPKGKILMDNTQLGTVGVWNVKVKSRRWFNIDHTYTNSSGEFQIGNKYRGQVHVNLEFQNSHCAIRGIRGYRIWQIADAVDIEVGQFQNSSMENITFNIKDDGNVKSEAKRRWMAATACNALEEYRQMAGLKGILPPQDHLNIWLTTEITTNDAASTPMLRKIGNRSAVSAWADLYLVVTGHPASVIIKRILTQFLPDVTLGYNFQNTGHLTSDNISFFLYHEFGHSSHYHKVGNSYWTPYIAYIITNAGYGTPSSSGSKRIELSEGWADYVGHEFANIKYPLRFTSTNLIYRWSDWKEKIEHFLPHPADFPFDGGGTMFDMTDNGEPIATGIRDEVDTYTMQEIFNAMPLVITSMQDFHSLILLQNNNKQKLAVDNLFFDYGF